MFEPKEVIGEDIESCIATHSADDIRAYKSFNGQPISLGIYYPDGYDKKRKYPVFLFIHGGGWASHKIFADQNEWAGDYLGYLARYYSRCGFVAVSIDYRIMPLDNKGQHEGYTLPDLVGDCVDALGYLKEREDELCLDFSRSVLLGESAGGYLAAALTTFKHKYHAEIKRSVLVNPIVDMTDYYWGKSVPQKLDDGMSLIERKIAMSPLHQIDNETPPVLLLHGTADGSVYPRHSVAFYDEMRLRSLETELHMFEGIDHAFLLAEFMRETNRPTAACKASIEIINEFVNDYINR